MTEPISRLLQIFFIRDQKSFSQVVQKKSKSDYLLNINKIVREKFDQEIIFPNKIQSFLINYEIKKLIDKAVNVRNRKYQRILYVNPNLTPNIILNTIDFLNGSYEDVKFEPYLLDLDEEFLNHPNLTQLKKGSN
jgi:hypothetical protein